MFFLIKRAGGIVKLPKQIDLTALINADEDDCFNASAVAQMLQINKQTFLNNLRKSKTPFLQLVPKGQILIKAGDLRRLLKFDHADARAAVEQARVERQKIIEEANRAFDNLTPAQKSALDTLEKPEVKNEPPAERQSAADKELKKAGLVRWKKPTARVKAYGAKERGAQNAKS